MTIFSFGCFDKNHQVMVLKVRDTLTLTLSHHTYPSSLLYSEGGGGGRAGGGGGGVTGVTQEDGSPGEKRQEEEEERMRSGTPTVAGKGPN